MNVLSWAWKQTIGSPGAKAVYVCLADHAWPNGYCFPSHAAVASRTEQSRRTVAVHIDWLVAGGWLSKEPRARANGSQTSNAYWVLAPDDVLEPCGEDGAPLDRVAKSAPPRVAKSATAHDASCQGGMRKTAPLEPLDLTVIEPKESASASEPGAGSPRRYWIEEKQEDPPAPRGALGDLPPAVWDYVSSKRWDGWIANYLAPCRWDPARAAVVARSETAVRELAQVLHPAVRESLGISIIEKATNAVASQTLQAEPSRGIVP